MIVCTLYKSLFIDNKNGVIVAIANPLDVKEDVNLKKEIKPKTQ